MRMRLSAAVAVLVLGLGACGDDGGDDQAGGATTTSEPSTATADETTTTTGDATTTTTAPAEGACPDDSPVPDDAADVQTAPVAFDGDGDGEDDVLRTYEHEGSWWVQVAWAAGGTARAEVVDAFMGARPLGGHDLDGDGVDEAFVAMAGPAAGSLVSLYRGDGCDLAPVTRSGAPFAFPVTSTIGTFSGASCDSIGDISLVSGELVGEEDGTYEAGETPYEYNPSTGEVTAGVGDGASVGFDEAGSLATLDCGMLSGAL